MEGYGENLWQERRLQTMYDIFLSCMPYSPGLGASISFEMAGMLLFPHWNGPVRTRVQEDLSYGVKNL